MDISIRKAEVSDIETIQNFGSKLLNYERENYDSSLDKDWAFSDEAKAKYLNAIQDKYVIIAEANGQPIGFLIGDIVAPKDGDARQIKQAFLRNIYVDEEYRKSGVGKKIFEFFKEHCINEGVRRLNVSVIAGNEKAVSFYNNVGFVPRSFNLVQEL